jgi:hypothetical protein
MAGSGSWGDYDNNVVRARAWVEAENVFEVWKLVQHWYTLMESGEALNRYPDPYWRDEDYPDKAKLTQDIADTFIHEMDEDFMLEKNRFQGRLAPEFSRLPSHARLAFVQEAYGIIKSSSQINMEADVRLAAGETMPPPVTS